MEKGTIIFPEDFKNTLNFYIDNQEIQISTTIDDTQFSCRCCYPASLVNTLRDILFFDSTINFELSIVDMCNCVSP